MRLYEILKENNISALSSNLHDLLIRAISQNQSRIELNKLMAVLQNQGYAVTQPALVDLLNGDTMVSNVDDTTVHLNVPGEHVDTAKDQQADADEVENMAMTAADKGLK